MDLFKGLFEAVRAKASEGICTKCGRKSKETYEGNMECTFSEKLVDACDAEALPEFKAPVKEEASNAGIEAAKKIDATSAAKSKSEVSKEKSATNAGAAQQDKVNTKAVGADAKDIKADDPAGGLQKQPEPAKNPAEAGKADGVASAALSKSDVSGEKSTAKAVNAAADKKNSQSIKDAKDEVKA